MESEVCKYNQFSYCKFRDSCVKRHENTLCNVVNCEMSCLQRHPKVCRFYSQQRYCKFGKHCKFKHEEKVPGDYEIRVAKLKEALNKSLEQIDSLKSKIEMLEKEQKQDSLADENDGAKN